MTKVKERKGEIVPKEKRELTPFEEMDRLFDQMWEGGFLKPFHSLWPDWRLFRETESRLPRVDVVDREKEVLVKAELPGIDKENLHVSLSDNYLTIKGEQHEEHKEEGEYFRSEIRHGSFTRTVQLPAEVDGNKAKASFKDGLLEITVPKVKEAVKHTISIS